MRAGGGARRWFGDDEGEGEGCGEDAVEEGLGSVGGGFDREASGITGEGDGVGVERKGAGGCGSIGAAEAQLGDGREAQIGVAGDGELIAGDQVIEDARGCGRGDGESGSGRPGAGDDGVALLATRAGRESACDEGVGGVVG